MYNYRYPDDRIKSKTVEELRGFEGQHVKEAYKHWAEHFGVDWKGRKYDVKDFEHDDLANKYLSALNHVFYGITTAVINILGYSPALGFIHTGHISSFVFDIADCFKEELTIPLAFKLTSETDHFDRHLMLKEYRQALVSLKIIQRMVDLLDGLFYNEAVVDVDLTFWNGQFRKILKNCCS